MLAQGMWAAALWLAPNLSPPVGTPPMEPASVDRLMGRAEGLWCPWVVQIVATPCKRTHG